MPDALLGGLEGLEGTAPTRRATAGRRVTRLAGWFDGPRIALLIAATFSAGMAVLLSQTVFSQLSVNNDESVYLLQARAFAAGHLFPGAGHPGASFIPWLGVLRGDHYVLKYTPVVAAFLALSLAVTGGYVLALAGWAAALVATTYLLTREVTGNRATAATAAVFMAVSPVVLVQSALLLPYLPFLVLAELAIWGILAGRRRQTWWPFALAGLCGGLAFVARSLDALLVLTPPLIWAIWTSGGRRLRSLCELAVGAIAPALGLLWFNYQATGSALRLPFSLFESGDTLGFGVHRLYPGEAARHFGPAQGWAGLVRHLSLLGSGWAFGGVLLLALAIYGLMQRPPAACLAILAGGLALTVGYLFFWGIWNAAIVWGATRYLGPYYLLPLLIALTMLAAIGLGRLASSSRWRAGSVLALALVLSLVTLIPAVRTNGALNADNVQLADAVAAKGRALVFVDTYPNYLQHPTAVISNDYPVGGRTVYALELGGADFTVLRDFPHRAVYRLSLLGEYGKHAHAGYGARLQRLRSLTSRALTLRVASRLPGSMAGARLLVVVGARRATWLLAPGQVSDTVVTLSAGPLSPAGDRPDRPFSIGSTRPGADGAIVVSLLARKAAGGREIVLGHIRLPIALHGGRLTTMAPYGSVTELGPARTPALVISAGAGG